MNRFRAFLLASLVLVPATAHAQTTGAEREKDAASSTPSRDEAEESFLRLRFDVTGGSLFASARSPRVSVVSASPAVRIDLGFQIGDHAALFARAEGGTIFLTSAGAAYVAGEWTPVRVLSFGTGIGYATINGSEFFYCNGASGCPLNQWSGVSVPAFVALNLGGDHRPDGTRSKLRIEFEGAAGYDRGTETYGFQGMLAVGGAWM